MLLPIPFLFGKVTTMEIRRVVLFLGESQMDVLVKEPSRRRLMKIRYDWKVRGQSDIPPANWVSTVEAEVADILTGRSKVPFA